MENLFLAANEEGVTILAASRSASTEVYRLNDGRLVLVEHLKSGRDGLSLIGEIPSYLTVRYDPPKAAVELLREFAPG